MATIASLTITAFGLPAQVLKNYRRKSCEGIAPSLIYSACISYTLWAAYGWFKHDLFLIIAQTPGCLFVYILLWQLKHYSSQDKLQNPVDY